VKINSPHMNLIALINSEMLYARALSEQVPYFKFASWIESTVQKEVIAQLFKSKKGAKSKIPEDLITDAPSSSAATPNTVKRQNAENKNQMKSQLIAFLHEKTKNIKLPKMPKLP